MVSFLSAQSFYPAWKVFWTGGLYLKNFVYHFEVKFWLNHNKSITCLRLWQMSWKVSVFLTLPYKKEPLWQLNLPQLQKQQQQQQRQQQRQQQKWQHFLIKRSRLKPVWMASISHPQTKSKVDQTRKWLNRIFDFTSTDDEPDKRIYWSLVSIPVLFFLVGVFYLCWNQCGLLKPYCSLCCTICKCCSISSICCNICCALCTKLEKEDLNPYYGADLDEATSVAEVGCVIVFIR